MVRKHVRTQEWDTATWGVPVSQEDMAHTVTLFSHVYTRGIEASGLPMTSAQKNDLSMFWSCVGYMLGVEESLLARSYEHELQLYAGFGTTVGACQCFILALHSGAQFQA